MLARTLRQVAVDLLNEVRRLDRRITDAAQALSEVVAASGTAVTDLHALETWSNRRRYSKCVS